MWRRRKIAAIYDSLEEFERALEEVVRAAAADELVAGRATIQHLDWPDDGGPPLELAPDWELGMGRDDLRAEPERDHRSTMRLSGGSEGMEKLIRRINAGYWNAAASTCGRSSRAVSRLSSVRTVET